MCLENVSPVVGRAEIILLALQYLNYARITESWLEMRPKQGVWCATSRQGPVLGKIVSKHRTRPLGTSAGQMAEGKFVEERRDNKH
jgi:hypothetical protein